MILKTFRCPAFPFLVSRGNRTVAQGYITEDKRYRVVNKREEVGKISHRRPADAGPANRSTGWPDVIDEEGKAWLYDVESTEKSKGQRDAGVLNSAGDHNFPGGKKNSYDKKEGRHFRHLLRMMNDRASEVSFYRGVNVKREGKDRRRGEVLK